MDLQYLQDYFRVCWGAEVYQEYEYYDLPLVPNIEMLKAPCRVSKTRLQVEMALVRKIEGHAWVRDRQRFGPSRLE